MRAIFHIFHSRYYIKFIFYIVRQSEHAPRARALVWLGLRSLRSRRAPRAPFFRLPLSLRNPLTNTVPFGTIQTGSRSNFYIRHEKDTTRHDSCQVVSFSFMTSRIASRTFSAPPRSSINSCIILSASPFDTV